MRTILPLKQILPAAEDCTLCHALLEHQISGNRDDKSAVIRALAYPHPVDIGDSYLTMNCSDCHGAGR